MGVEERRVGVSGDERRVPQHVDQQVAVGAYTMHAGTGERIREQCRCLLPAGPVEVSATVWAVTCRI